jgi:pilus assembly protein Flp/PilA
MELRTIIPRIVVFFRDSERGASMVEYALLIVLIAVVAIVAVNTVGPPVSAAFSSAGDGFTP